MRNYFKHEKHEISERDEKSFKKSFVCFVLF